MSWKKKFLDNIVKNQDLLSTIKCFSYCQVVIEKYPNSDIQNIDQRQRIFSLSEQFTCAALMCLIRRRVNVPQDKAIFMFVEGEMPPLR